MAYFICMQQLVSDLAKTQLVAAVCEQNIFFTFVKRERGASVT